MTDDPWINFFVILTVGANLATLTLWMPRRRRPRSVWRPTRGSRCASARRHGLAIAAIVATTAMLGSLYLSEGAHLPPCRLCWYQRIAMYSLAVILVVAAVRRDWNVRPYALALGLIGPCDLDLPLPDRAIPELGERDVVRPVEPVHRHVVLPPALHLDSADGAARRSSSSIRSSSWRAGPSEQ